MTTQALAPHGTERHEWTVPGDGPPVAKEYASSVPPPLATAVVPLRPETLASCAQAGTEIAFASRINNSDSSHSAAVAALLLRIEASASAQVDGGRARIRDLARVEAGLPSTKDSRALASGLESLAAHVTAARRALGLGAMGAAHTAPHSGPQRRQVARYRAEQTWLGGSDMWPTGADYIPPLAEHVPVMMDDLVAFCARTDMDPIAQAAVAHAQLLSIQPFPDGNGRAARALLNGVLVRRGLTSDRVVPISAAILGDSRRYASAWRAYREGDAEPMVSLVARHAMSAVVESAASAERMAALPEVWMASARPRRGSTAHALIGLMAAQPILTAVEVMRLTGASQASAYEAIARLAEAGVLRRLTASRRGSVWFAGDVFAEAELVLGRLGGRLQNSAPSRR